MVFATGFLAEPIEVGTELVLLLDVVYDLLMGKGTEDITHGVVTQDIVEGLTISQDGLDAMKGALVLLDERILSKTL